MFTLIYFVYRILWRVFQIFTFHIGIKAAVCTHKNNPNQSIYNANGVCAIFVFRFLINSMVIAVYALLIVGLLR